MIRISGVGGKWFKEKKGYYQANCCENKNSNNTNKFNFEDSKDIVCVILNHF